MRFVLEAGETNSTQILKDKFTTWTLKNQEPSPQFVADNLQGMVDARVALETLFERDRRYLTGQVLQRIKR